MKNTQDLIERTTELCEMYIKLTAWLDNPKNRSLTKFDKVLVNFQELIKELSLNFNLLDMADLNDVTNKQLIMDFNNKKAKAIAT